MSSIHAHQIGMIACVTRPQIFWRYIIMVSYNPTKFQIDTSLLTTSKLNKMPPTTRIIVCLVETTIYTQFLHHFAWTCSQAIDRALLVLEVIWYTFIKLSIFYEYNINGIILFDKYLNFENNLAYFILC